jgi:hypothetical protein
MSPKDHIMLKRIYRAEPWAGQTGEEKPVVTPEPGKRKKQVAGRNKIARGKGIEL